jgi:ABC-type branched-subunit amino acid transport system permease subunit
VKTLRYGGWLVVLLFVLIFPIFLSPNNAITDMAVLCLIYAMAATGWNIFSGFTGYISIGHAVYFGVGAYTMALVCQHWNVPGGYLPFLLLPVCGLIALVFSIPLGMLALRVRKYAFSITTISLMFIFQLLAYNLTGLTSGSAGIFLPVPPWQSNLYDLPFYYVSLLLLLVAIFVAWRVRHSQYGLGLLAIRDDEDRAFSLGVMANQYKLVAYMISAFFVGLAGAMFGYFVGSVLPQFTFDPIVDVNITTIAFLGGLGTLSGPLLGAVLVVPLQQYLLLQFGGESLNLILFGFFLLLVLLFLPKGIVTTLHTKWSSWKVSRSKIMNAESASGKELPALAERGKM